MKRYPAKIFFCYSHKDEKLRSELEKHLKMLERQGIIINWHDRKILPGKNWNTTIESNLDSSDIVLLLLSPDFLASDYCVEVEMKRAFELHKNGHLQIVPVLFRICDWKNSEFSKFQGLPSDMEPVISSKWYSEDEAFYNIVQGLKEIIFELFDENEFQVTVPEQIEDINESDNSGDELFQEVVIRKAVLVLRSLNHSLRNRICKFIDKESPVTISTIYKKLHISHIIASQHLAILRRAGVVDASRNGKYIFYSLNYQRIKTINEVASKLQIDINPDQ